MSTPERPTKRARQACEPCRRKKSRCPGEKPICSHCARLRQVCTYARERGDSEPQDDLQLDVAANAEAMTAERLKMLERGMAQIQSVLSGQVVAMEPSRNAEIPPRQPVRSNEHHSLAMPSSGNAGGPPESEIEAAAVLYLKFCDCQPLPLFSMHEWAEGLQLREPEVVLAVVALANRFDTAEKTYLVTKRHLYMEQARSLVLQRLISGPIEISTIQTLCLLSLVYFNESATARASSFSALACDLAQSAGLATELPGAQPASSREERRRCYWSLTLLRNLFGNMNGNIAFISTDFPPQYPKSAEPPAKSSLNITEPGLPQPDGPLDNANNASSEADHGIMATVVSLSAVWIKTVRYVCRRGKSQRLPSWVPESEYQQILTELMTIESHMPYKYRYKPARFDEYNDDELQQSRTFWAPWLLNQILYHSILCLLNHPLILSLHLRNLRMTMVPEIFLQHTDDLIQTHTSWVVHLVDQILAKDFRLTDPYPPYCVGIVATIFLQQSYSDDERVRANKQENFTKCLRFVRQAGNYWPRVATLVGPTLLLLNFD